MFFALVAVLLTALEVFSLMQMAAIRAAGSEIDADWMPSQAAADDMALHFAHVQIGSMRQLAFHDAETLRQSDEHIAAAMKRTGTPFPDVATRQCWCVGCGERDA